MEYTAAVEREWLETNGLGGFASSTVSGLNTRRYHGLLVAATRPPVGRMVLLSRFEEVLESGGVRYALSTNRYPGTIHPRGFEYLERFEADLFPTFVYRAGEVEVRKTVFMVHGENTTVIEYEIDGDASLELKPLIAFRDYHSLTHRNDALNPAVVGQFGYLVFAPYAGLPTLHLAHHADSVNTAGEWYLNHEYDREIERGLDYQEDLFCPCTLRFEGKQHVTVIASLEPRAVTSAPSLRKAEKQRRTELAESAPVDCALVKRLLSAADQFVVRRGDFHTIIAGYPWFTDWGRDTMIALPGIALVTGRLDIARDILLAFADSIDRGMLPNRFPDAGEMPEYNTVDATLWFFDAVRSYVAYSGDSNFATDVMYPRLREIIDWHLRGTRYGICADADGLLRCGEPGVQLTWMDAKIGDWVVTPRQGKPVEIQALWYNALMITADLAVQASDPDRASSLRQLAARTRASFNEQFWNSEAGCLYDCIDGQQRDASIRPNQIFAVSLHHPTVDGDRAVRVLRVIEERLLTPLGLRSLAPAEPGYRGVYQGGVYERDSSYHQGTVWPWLMGPFLQAYVRVNGGSAESREQALRWTMALAAHLDDACVGQISEITDAEPPHTPRGCLAQAWSVAELLRTLVEDVYGVEPRPAPAIAAVGA